MTAPDRVTFNDVENWTGPDYAVGRVDEIVLHDATVHLESLDDATAHLRVVTAAGREVTAVLRARPASREEKRQILTSGGDWSRAARRAADAVLCIDIEDDTGEDQP